MIRLVQIEPNAMMRQILGELLGGPELRVVASFARLPDLTPDRVADLAPDAVLVTVDGRENSFEHLRRWHGRHPDVKLVAMLADGDLDRALEAVQAGAGGIVLSSAAAEDVARAVMLVSMGETVFPAEIAARLAELGERRSADDVPARTLNDTEKTILGYLRAGCSNQQIALFTRQTDADVKVAIHAIFRKLKVRNRTQAALWAARNPHLIVTPDQVALIRRGSRG